MKRIREYHIERYWAAEAAKRQKRAELKEKVGDYLLAVLLIGLEMYIGWEFMKQLCEII